MACSCIKQVFDFDLVQDRCDSIKYIDRSVWMQGAIYDPNPTYELSLTDPFGSVRKYQVVVGTSLSLDLGDCVRPGIYKFQATPCDDTFTKYAPILCTLECGYLKGMVKIEQGVKVPFMRSIRERLDEIPHLVGYGNLTKAQDLTETVIDDLHKINCSDCGCS